jgi:phosphoenolpyruvate synthase/pyruvate phosphate dikinase
VCTDFRDGQASGKVVFDADEAQSLAAPGERVILVRHETSPDDFHGMVTAQASSPQAAALRGLGA